MPFVSRRAQLKLSTQETETLTALSQSRSEPAGRVQRASILLRYRAGDTVSEIARSLGTNRPLVERCVSKALGLGATQALADLPGRGRSPAMTAEARAWVVALACQKPKDLGYAQGLLTTRAIHRFDAPLGVFDHGFRRHPGGSPIFWQARSRFAGKNGTA